MHLISIAVNNCFCCCCCNVRYFRICMRHQWNHFIVLIFFFIYLYIIILSFELFYYFSLELLSLLSCQKTIIWVLCKIYCKTCSILFPRLQKGCAPAVKDIVKCSNFKLKLKYLDFLFTKLYFMAKYIIYVKV